MTALEHPLCERCGQPTYCIYECDSYWGGCGAAHGAHISHPCNVACPTCPETMIKKLYCDPKFGGCAYLKTIRE